MNFQAFLIIALAILVVSPAVQARDDYNRYSIEDALNIAEAKKQLNKGYTFKFGNTQHKAIKENHGEFMSNKKTNAVGKSDKFACQWAFLSAMISFQDRIEKEGGNAVVNIRSYYKKNELSSETEFECGNGAVIAGVTFLGDVVTLAK